MKITDIKTYGFWLGFRNICLVKVETDQGIYGWGESGLSGREQAVIGAVEHFKHFLIGQSALNINALWQEMYRSQYFEGGRVLAAAISAIDIALHDACGKYFDMPVYQLLGGKQRERIPLFVTSTLDFGDAFIDHVCQLKDEGWQAIRATTGEHGTVDKSDVFDARKSIAKASTWLTKARETLGSQTVLGIDYHHRLTVPETASFCQRMPSGTLDFIEEPIRDQSLVSYQNLRAMVDVPFAIGEEFSSKWDFAPYVDSALTNFARIDICNAGGFSEAMKIAAMCETRYIDMMPHNPLSPICTAASVHYCAALSNLSWLEVAPYDGDLAQYDDIFSYRPKVSNNTFEVTNRPGLGIDVNESSIPKDGFKFWEPPRLIKPDGSYTNW
ncbi:mandelate racemase/muconate lactonizing enzyme family protein [Paraglaciecola chathamensis]|uniref:mandelate racemase/muconate lactonizing enzyme family protein n=1 Tax=Paraglaciecola chathamensis TaxID=368405 RepID=UPI0026FAFAC9|nr:mandelate racemase/muconate lactonizing enzyme family protein [Paraglaciecola chathamensis]MDO6842032.1 mandelate racemase/muconate lactonizing enzyme family protein [Paraglaciecola chathamensis]